MRTRIFTPENHQFSDVKIACNSRLHSSGKYVNKTGWGSYLVHVVGRSIPGYHFWLIMDQNFLVFRCGTLNPVFAPDGTIPQMAVCRGGWLIHPSFMILNLIRYYEEISDFRRFL